VGIVECRFVFVFFLPRTRLLSSKLVSGQQLRSRDILVLPWRSQVFESGGYTKNRTYRRPYASAVGFGWESGGPVFLRMKLNLGLAEMQLRGLLAS